MNRTIRVRGLLIVIGIAACVSPGAVPGTATAQDVPTLLIHARLRRIAHEAAERHGIRLPLKGLDPLGPQFARRAAAGMETEPVFEAAPSPIDSAFPVTFEVVSRIQRPVFSSRFARVGWAFLQGKTFEPLDTTRTVDLRARLEAHFGAPTKTLAELDSVESLPVEEVVQFEYWFVLNDSIPLVVLDVNGPMDRGLVVASDSRYRDRLNVLRGHVLNRLFDTNRRAPYVDYWYRTQLQEWSVVGFDGATFFDRRIAPPRPGHGRPMLSDVRSGSRGR